MERRYFLSLLGAVQLAPQLVINGKVASASAEIKSGHYLMFVDPSMVNVEAIANGGGDSIPKDCSVEIICVKLRGGMTMDEAVRLYQVGDAGS